MEECHEGGISGSARTDVTCSVEAFTATWAWYMSDPAMIVPKAIPPQTLRSRCVGSDATHEEQRESSQAAGCSGPRRLRPRQSTHPEKVGDPAKVVLMTNTRRRAVGLGMRGTSVSPAVHREAA